MISVGWLHHQDIYNVNNILMTIPSEQICQVRLPDFAGHIVGIECFFTALYTLIRPHRFESM